ncbi:MAG: serine/threonine-protein kinase PknK, partial [Cyanobacteria bacterium P01_C01_bin.120]
MPTTSTLPHTAQLSGYRFAEVSYQGSRTTVYRAIEEATQQPVVIKVLSQDYPSFGELVQFRNQFVIAKNLPISGIIHPLSLESYGNGYALVMEDFDGIDLGRYLQQHPLSPTEVLEIAIQLANILHELHQHRVIHKDIKPANILIHPGSQQVKLLDFSIASLLPKETQDIQNPNVLEGTLSYLAPEQTGRMNRAIDYRTDFYALGVTLYELLTGQLPFISEDPLELLHCHIAQEPLQAHELNSEVPPILALLVQKLMAKNAEDRYQSALGLKHDLQVLQRQYAEQGSQTWFTLGEQDVSDRFTIPEKLYGREDEVSALLSAFNRVTAGGSELMLVAGFSGIGKTAVVNEVHKPITRQRGYFIKGKFDQFNRNIPFSAFVQAFRSLMAQLMSESDTVLADWKTRILAAVGENGQVLIDVIPELENVIGAQPPAPELSGAAAQNRFNLLFEKFIAVFTTPEHPLVLFLDDLQWADSASLNLMKVLMGDSNRCHLLLLGAYRDNEVFPAHPLMLNLDEMEKQGANLHTITLQPLGEEDINHLVADMLLCDLDVARPLSQLVYQKTKGNPFFTTQFLRGLYQENRITFNGDVGYWLCDLTQARQLALTDDVVEFMVSRLQKLPQATQDVLRMAACIGNQFDLATLAIVCEHSQEKVSDDLWRSLQDGLVIPETETYKFFQGDAVDGTTVEDINVRYRFLHDRVQQAAYSLIPERQKQSTHLQMGRLLLQNLSPEAQKSQLFAIVNHWNQAQSLITLVDEQQKLTQLNLEAGQKAQGSAAYEAAFDYFGMALSLLEADCWQQRYSTTLELHEARAEAAYLTGQFEAMERNIDQVLNHAKNKLDCTKVYEIKIQAHMAQQQGLESLMTGIDFLSQLDLEVPESPKVEDIQVEIANVEKAMAGKKISDLAELPLMSDRTQIAKVVILVQLLAPCYQIKPELFPWVTCKFTQLSIQYGNTSQSACIYSTYGMVRLLILRDFGVARDYMALACQLDSHPQTGDGTIGRFTAGSCLLHYYSHVRDAFPTLLEGYQSGLERGNFQFAGYSLYSHTKNSFFAGGNLAERHQEFCTLSQVLENLKQGNTLVWGHVIEQAVLNLLGEADTPWELVGTAFNEHQSLPLLLSNKDRTGLNHFYLSKLTLCFLFDQIDLALDNAKLAKEYVDGVACFVDEYVLSLYDSLTQLAYYPQADQALRQEILQTIKTNQAGLKHWAEFSPMNAQHKYDLVEAEKYRVLNKNLEAIDYYDRAIAGAKTNEYTQEEALANELAAKFYLDWGKEKIAAVYMQEAYYAYSRWGAKAKIADLEARYPELLRPILQPAGPSGDVMSTLMSVAAPTLSVHSSTHHSSNTMGLNQTLDFASVLKASQVLSSVIEFDELLSQLTQIILQNSGGDRCALALLDEAGHWQVRAMATPDGT